MDYILLGIGGVFVLSVAIVLLTSWIAGRGGGYRRKARRATYEEEFYAPSPRPRPKPLGNAENPGMQADIVREIMETEIPDSPVKKPVSQPKARESSSQAILEEFEDIDIEGLEDKEEEKDIEFDIEDSLEVKEPEKEEYEDLEIFEDLEEETYEERVQIEKPQEPEPVESLDEELDDELDFLYEEESREDITQERKKSEEAPEQEVVEEKSRPDCFGNPEIYSQCSKSCGFGEECSKAISTP